MQEPKRVNESGKDVLHINRSSGVLFPEGSPSLADINQRGIGNCYFLSAMAMIIAKPNGQQIIRDMIKEGPAHDQVTVRFFDDKGEAFHVKIDKSIRLNPVKRAGGPLWIILLEKAYTQTFLEGDYNKLNEGGYIGQAVSQLIGDLPITRYVHDANPAEVYILASAFNHRNSDIFKSHLHLADHEYATWWDFVTKHDLEKKWNSIIKKQGMRIDDKQFRVEVDSNHLHTLRFEDFNELVSSEKDITEAQKQVLTKILSYARVVLPGKRGTGQYTAEEKDIYNSIKENLDDHFLVGASTHTKIKDRSRAANGLFKNPLSQGEDENKGLVGGHAYAVLGCYERNGRRFIKLKNPWNLPMGRTYSEKESKVLSAESTRSREFDMELSDFCKRIDYIDVVGCYLTYTKSNGCDYTPSKVPAYVIAQNGLYFVTEKTKITDKNLVTNDPAKLQTLKMHLERLSPRVSDEQTSSLQIDQREKISRITDSFVADEKNHSETKGTLCARSSANLSAMTFDRVPDYILTPDGLYQVNRLDAGKVTHTRLVDDPLTVNWLWVKMTGQVTPDDETYNLTDNQPALSNVMSPYRDIRIINQVIHENEFKFNANEPYDPVQYPIAYMREFNLSPGLIKTFISAFAMLIDASNIDLLKSLLSKINPVQMQGLVNLNMKFGNETNAVEGNCFEIVKMLDLAVADARLKSVFPRCLLKANTVQPIQAGGGTINTLEEKYGSNKHSYNEQDITPDYNNIREYLKKYDLSPGLVKFYGQTVNGIMEDNSLISVLNGFQKSLHPRQLVGLSNMRIRVGDQPDTRMGKLIDLVPPASRSAITESGFGKIQDISSKIVTIESNTVKIHAPAPPPPPPQRSI